MPDTGLLPVAEKLAASAARHASQADTGRRLAAQVVEEIREAGFARHFVPSRWGGNEATFTEMTRAVVAVAEGCASTAWCASLSAYSSRFAAYLPIEGQRDIWAGTPDLFIATGLVPAGSAVEVEGGSRIAGRWNYLSGIDFADWALLCGPASGEGAMEARFFAVPRGSWEVLPTWDSVGLRATGSHSVVLDDVFVPEHRMFARTTIMGGRNTGSTAVCHNAPFGAVGGLTFAAPALGAAKGALAACVDALAGKRRTASTEVALTRASAQIDAAELLVQRAAAAVDDNALTKATVVRNSRDQSVAAELLVEAVSGLVRAAGTSGLAESLPLQRHWRDVTAATSHVALRVETSAPRYAEVLLG